MASYPIFQGKWTNYGDPKGEQYTLPVYVGAVVISATAAFVTLAGGQLWSLIALLVHQIRAKPGPHDGYFHYSQAAYRNLSSPLGLAWSLIRGAGAYGDRRKTPPFKRRGEKFTTRVKRRMLGLGGLAVMIWLLYTAGSIASPYAYSHAAQTANTGLVQEQNCGIVNRTGQNLANNLESRRAFAQYKIRTASEALQYTDACYNSSDPLACSVYVVPKLTYTTNFLEECPFGTRCKAPAMVLNTPWIDSHDHLGINAVPSDRIALRKELTCAVVDVTDLTDMVPYATSTDTSANSTVTGARNGSSLYRYEYWLGPIAGLDYNYTTYTNQHPLPDDRGYSVQSFQNLGGSNQSAVINAWQAIDDFRRTDGDVSVLVISFGNIAYQSPVKDPLYRTSSDMVGEAYFPAKEAGFVACIDRWQIQSADGSKHTALSSFTEVNRQWSTIGLNVNQFVTAARIMLGASTSTSFNVLDSLGILALQAQRSLISTVSTGLPDDQWQWEVKAWFNIVLADVQRSVVSFVYKPDSDLDAGVSLTFINGTTTYGYANALRAMCKQQKIRNIGSYQTFALNPLIAIYATCAGIILLSLIVEPIYEGMTDLKAWRMRKHDQTFVPMRLRQWKMDSIHQLQRIAYQNSGQGEWERCKKDIPAVRGEIGMVGLDSETPGYRPVPHETELGETPPANVEDPWPKETVAVQHLDMYSRDSSTRRLS